MEQAWKCSRHTYIDNVFGDYSHSRMVFAAPPKVKNVRLFSANTTHTLQSTNISTLIWTLETELMMWTVHEWIEMVLHHITWLNRCLYTIHRLQSQSSSSSSSASSQFKCLTQFYSLILLCSSTSCSFLKNFSDLHNFTLPPFSFKKWRKEDFDLFEIEQ